MTSPFKPPVSNVSEPSPQSSLPHQGYFAGTKPLWKAFWLVFVITNGAVAILTSSAISTPLIFGFMSLTGIFFHPLHFAILISLVRITCLAITSVILWRCAVSTSSRLALISARVFVVLYSAWWLWQFAIFFVFTLPRLYG